jgi:hypothetical protein
MSNLNKEHYRALKAFVKQRKLQGLLTLTKVSGYWELYLRKAKGCLDSISVAHTGRLRYSQAGSVGGDFSIIDFSQLDKELSTIVIRRLHEVEYFHNDNGEREKPAKKRKPRVTRNMKIAMILDKAKRSAA